MFLIAVKLIGTVVLQVGCGADVMIRIDPLPVDDVGESKVPFNEITAETPGDGATVVATWNVFPMIGWGESSVTVVKPSVTPHAGPANPTWNRATALLDTTQVSAHRCGEPEVGVHACEVVPLQLPSNCPGDVPDCVMTTFSPATARVPVRDDPDGFAATEKVTLPLPVPEAPAVIATKEELLTAVQEQPGSAVTAMVPVPPDDGNDAGLGLLTV